MSRFMPDRPADASTVTASGPESGAVPAPDLPTVDSFTPLITTLGSQALKASALLGAVAYAVVRLGYESYYGWLGVRPEEVGLDHTTVIIHAIVGVVVFLAFFGGFLLVVALPTRAVIDWLRRRHWAHQAATLKSRSRPGRAHLVTPSQTETEWLVAALFPAVWTLYMLAEWVGTDDSGLHPYVFVGLAWAAWLFAWWRYRRVRHKPVVHYRHALMIAVLAGVFALLLMSDNLGAAAGPYLQNHGQLPDSLSSSIATLSLSSDCVMVIPTAGFPSAVKLQQFAVYLGEANGTDVLYDALGTQRPIRLPASQVVLISTDPQHCAAP